LKPACSATTLTVNLTSMLLDEDEEPSTRIADEAAATLSATTEAATWLDTLVMLMLDALMVTLPVDSDRAMAVA